MKLYQMFKDYPVLSFTGSALTEINQLAYDSRRVLEGTLFACLVGENLDGHDFISEAVNRKAAAIMIQEELSESDHAYIQKHAPETAVLRVADCRAALAFISCNFYPFSLESLNIHILVGEIGKGSYGLMLYSLLHKLNKQVSLIDEMQILSVGKKRFLPRNHPEMTEICAVLSELGEGDVILPFSYKDLELKRGLYLSPDTCSILQADREELSRVIALASDKTFFFANADSLSEDALPLTASLQGRFLSYGITSSADLRARELRIETRRQNVGTSFILDYPDGSSAEFFVALPGRHQVYNALALLTWAYHAGIPLAALQEYLSELSLPGRSELVVAQDKVEQDFVLMIDNAWSATQIKNLLQSLRPYCRNRLLLLASAGGDRSTEMRQALAAEAIAGADYVCFTVSNPRSEGAAAILSDMTEHINREAFAFDCIEDREAAIRHIVGLAEQGDLVVLSGKAQDSYHIDAQSTEPFSEFEVAKKALQERTVVAADAK